MACFPALAQAEESSGIQYETDVPTVPDNGSSNIPEKNSSGDTDDGSDAEAGDSTAPDGAGTGGGGSDSGTGGGTDKGQTNQGSGGNGEQGVGGSKPAGGQQGEAKAIELTPASDLSPATSDEDDSSPLVPILIAIAVLAAISVGAFYYRQRRQGDAGSPISPKAS
jgi:hypothetical protein